MTADKEIHDDDSRGAKVYPTDDLWICDPGAVFVFDKKENLTIVNWNFDRRGTRQPYAWHNQVPLPIVSPTLIIEGGRKINGTGALLAIRSSIINPNRNPGASEILDIRDFRA